MLRPLNKEEKRKFVRDMCQDLFDRKYPFMDLDELFDLAKQGDRVAILVLLSWEECERKKGETADKHRLVVFESLLDKTIDDIQRDDELLLKRAFWQTRNL